MRAAVLTVAILASAAAALYVGMRATEERDSPTAEFTAAELTRPPATVALPHAAAWKEVRRTLDALGYRVIELDSLDEHGTMRLSDPGDIDLQALASSVVAQRGSSNWTLTVAFEPNGAASTIITVGARVRSVARNVDDFTADLRAGAAEMDGFIDKLALWKR